MNSEPKMFVSPFYTQEFYNKCHDKGGLFCEGDSGGEVVKGKATDENHYGNAYSDHLTDLNTVYHVVSPEIAKTINEKGFDTKYADSNNNWGRGLYFSPNKSDSLGAYAATAHQQGKEASILKVRTNVQNPLILETDTTGNFWGQLRNVLDPETVNWHTHDAKTQTDPDEWLDWDRYAKNNLRSILNTNGNDGLLVRNPGGGGHNIGGETLVVTDSSKVWLAD